ncbi:conserved hypothetical protein [Vibrio harveyi 1DA3]|nr:conserved hypothetical protein [Vibrio harveyi 1DA3]
MDWFNFVSVIIVCWVFIAYCLPDWRKVVWPKMTQEKPFQHLVFATLFLLCILWSAQAGVKDGLQIHFLALTTLTMMYGWRIAFLLSIPAMLVNHLLHGISLSMLPSAWVLSALVPILISYLIFCSATVTFHVTFLFSFLWQGSSMEHSLAACIYSSTRFIIFLWVTTTGKLSNTITLFSFRYSPSLKGCLMGCLWLY